MAITVPGASGAVTISAGTGDVLQLASQIGALLSTIQGAASLTVTTTDSVSGAIPTAPQVISDEPTGTEADVYRLYQALFNRMPDAGGLAVWTSLIDNSGASLENVANAMTLSTEYTQGMGTLSNADFIEHLYQNMFERSPEGNTGQLWADLLGSGASRGSVTAAIAESEEARSGAHPTVEQNYDAEIFRLYEAAFGRTPDEGGESAWLTMLANGHSGADIAAGIAASDEFRSFDASLLDDAFITQMYLNALGRQPESGAVQAWVLAMNAGLSRADVLLAFADSAESKGKWAGSTDDDRPLTNELLLNGGPGGLIATVPSGYDYIVVNDATPDGLTASNAAIIAGTVGGTFFVSGNSTVAAVGGNNIVNATGEYELSFGSGNNLIIASGSGTIATGAGTSKSKVFASNTSGPGNVIDSNGHDFVDAFFGNNLVNVTGDNSTVSGGVGNLTVSLTGTNDVINGVGSALTVNASGSGLFVNAGTGPLNFVGGAGGATIIGGAGGSTVFGSTNSDITFNGSGNLAYSATGNATLNAALSTGNATLNAALSTGNVNASLGGGADSIIAGGGAETLDGGAGANQFLFDNANTNGNAIDITDTAAQVASDTFTFTGYAILPAPTLNTDGHVQLSLSDGTTVTFTNLTDPNALTGRIA
jgi:hypothetical protein